MFLDTTFGNIKDELNQFIMDNNLSIGIDVKPMMDDGSLKFEAKVSKKTGEISAKFTIEHPIPIVTFDERNE